MQQDSVQNLLQRARFDEQSADILLAHGGPESIIGFLCQQAIEKMLKAVLVSKGVHVPKTHDIVYLKQLLQDAGAELPQEFADLDLLAPFAVDERYGDTGASGRFLQSARFAPPDPTKARASI
jgi:HEPN domain-containing protein